MSDYTTPGTKNAPALSWQERLDTAASLDEVVDTCRDFAAMLTPAEVHSLPPSCRPPGRLDEETIPEYALDLVRCEQAAGDSALPLMRTLSTFFAKAATGIARHKAPRKRLGARDAGR